jgi:hypothetical protein
MGPCKKQWWQGYEKLLVTAESNKLVERKEGIGLPRHSRRKATHGFWDLKHLICYTAVVHGGNRDEVWTTVRKVTWCEEMVIYCEGTWGRGNQYWQDYERNYGCTEEGVRKAIMCRGRK